MSKWPTEDIPDGDRVFRNINKRYALNGMPTPDAFDDKDDEPSVCWELYCIDPSDCPKRMNADQKVYQKYGVCALKVGLVREIKSQDVIHKPSKQNRAHSIIKGEKTERVLLRLCEIANVPIVPIPTDNEVE